MKTAKLFMNGQSQAVRLPKNFRMKGGKVYIKKSGNCIILIPVDDPWKPLLESIGQFSGDFFEAMKNRKLPDQERDWGKLK